MSLPEIEKQNGLALSEAEDVLPQEEKQPEGSFKDYLVRESLSSSLQEHSQLRRLRGYSATPTSTTGA